MKTTWKLNFFLLYFIVLKCKTFRLAGPFAFLKNGLFSLIDELANDFWLYAFPRISFHSLKNFSPTHSIFLPIFRCACMWFLYERVCDDYQLTNIKVNDPQPNRFYNTSFVHPKIWCLVRGFGYFFFEIINHTALPLLWIEKVFILGPFWCRRYVYCTHIDVCVRLLHVSLVIVL